MIVDENNATPAERAEKEMTRARRIRLIRLVEDHAARYFQLSYGGGSIQAAARYIAEGHAKANPREWAWIADYITAHPEVLTMPVRNDADLAARNEKQREVWDQEAAEHFVAARWADALACIDHAESFIRQEGYLDHLRQYVEDAARAACTVCAGPCSCEFRDVPGSNVL